MRAHPKSRRKISDRVPRGGQDPWIPPGRVAALIMYLAVLLVGGTLTGGARWYGASMSHAAAVSILLVFVFTVPSLRSSLRSRDVFGWLSVGFLIVVAAGSLASPVPPQSALGLLELLAGSALFALCRRYAATPDGRLAVAQLLGAGGVAVAIIACVELIRGAATAPATAPFGQRNFLGAYVALVGPVLVGLAAIAREGWKRWGWGIAAIGLYVSLGFSRSMLGVIGAAGGVGVLGLYILFERMGNRLRRLAVPIAVVATLALIATPIALGLAVSLETLGTPASRVSLERPAVPFVADFSRLVDNLTGRLDPGARGRPVYWRGALTALEERPLLGYGLRSTPFVYAGIRLQPSFRVGSVELDQLHSTPVHLAFETGWLGLSIVTAGFAVALWRGFATPGGPIGRPAVCGVASYAIAVSTNYDLNLEAMGATVALALGLLLPVKPTDAMVQSPHGGFHRNDRGVRLGLAAATFVTAAAFLVPVDVAHYLHDQAVRTYGQEAIAGRLPAKDRRPAYREALELEQRAAQWDRHAGWYDLQAAAILERTADDEARAGRDSRPAVLQALGHLRRARDAAPPKIALVRQEAALLHRLEDWPRAIPALQHAVAIHFYHPQPHFLLGEAYFREGEALAARREFGIALALAPALASATRWTASPNNRVEQGHAVAAARGLVLARPWPGAADLHARLLGVLGKASDLPPVGDSVAKRGILHWPVDIRWEDRGTFSYRRLAIPASPGAVAVYSELAKAMHQQGIASSGAYPMVRAEKLLRDGAPEPFDASPLPVKRPS